MNFNFLYFIHKNCQFFSKSLLAFLIIPFLFSTSAFARTVNGDSYITTTELKSESGTNISNGGTIKLDYETYNLTYRFVLPDKEFKKDDEVIFSVPDEFKIIEDGSFQVYASDGGVLGTANIATQNTISLVFTTDYIEKKINVSGRITLLTSINRTYVKETTIVKFPGEIIIKIEKEEDTPDEPTTPEDPTKEPGIGGKPDADQDADKKNGVAKSVKGGRKAVVWTINLGRKTLLKGRDSFDEVQSITLIDTPIGQHFVRGTDLSWVDWIFYKAWFDIGNWDYGDIVDGNSEEPYNNETVTFSSDLTSFEMDVLDFIRKQEINQANYVTKYNERWGTNYEEPKILEFVFTYSTRPILNIPKKLKNNVTIEIVYKDGQRSRWVLTDEVAWTIGSGEADGEEVIGGGSKDLEVQVKWMVQPDKYRPAMEQDCEDYESNIDIYEDGDNEGNLGYYLNSTAVSCGTTAKDLRIEPNAEQRIISSGFTQRSKTIYRGEEKDLIIFINQKCANGQEPTGKNQPCVVTPPAPPINIPGIITPPTTGTPLVPIVPNDPWIPGINPPPPSNNPPVPGEEPPYPNKPPYPGTTPPYPGNSVPPTPNGNPPIPGITPPPISGYIPPNPNYPNTPIPPVPGVPCIKLGNGCEPPGRPGITPPPSGVTPPNPVFVPPEPINEVPTQVSNKSFKTTFIEPNMKINLCNDGFCKGVIYPPISSDNPPYEGEIVPEDPNNPEPSDPFVPVEVSYKYKINYCNPYTGVCENIPLEDDEAFYKWIGGKFYVYLLDVMVNPDYIAQSQVQATQNADMELKTSLPFYFGGADLKLDGNKGKVLSNHSPYKAYEIKMKIDKVGYHPYYDMENIRVPDAHQKVSFMVKFIPNLDNKNLLEYNVVNTDHFAVRPAYFVIKTDGFIDDSNVNNILVNNKPSYANKARITSSFSSNEDFHTKLYYPSDYRSGLNAYGVPNYQIGLGFYESNPPTGLGGLNKIDSSKLIKTDQSVVSVNVKDYKPNIKGVVKTCKYKAEDICSNGLCSTAPAVQSQTRGSSRRRSVSPVAVANSNTVIWTDNNMLIEAMFGYFNNENYIGQSAAHNKIKAIREKLVYYPGTTPTSSFDRDENSKAYETRSLISTHLFGDKRVFTYNNIGDMQVVIVDNKWTVYDQYPRDALGRLRASKCVVGSGTNVVYPSTTLNGCNVDMENSEVIATYVPEFIELNPVKVDDMFHSDGKDFTYFANKVGTKNMDDMNNDEKSAQMYATYEFDATAYVSQEIYGTPVTKEFGYLDNKYTKELPLIAYGYENQYGTSTGCGRDVDFFLNFDFDCGSSSFADVKIADKIVKRCAPVMSAQRDECKDNPLDSRCHGGINNDKDKNFVNHDLKFKFNIFNTDENQTVYSGDGNQTSNDSNKTKLGYNLSVKDFKNGSATKGNIMYFNFERSVNYPTNPKVVNVNDFYISKIIQKGFSGNDKTFISSKDNKTQEKNKFVKAPLEKAIKNNAHFYYGYVNSSAKEYYVCSKNNSKDCANAENPVNINVMFYNNVPNCQKYPQVCDSSFLEIADDPNFDKNLYITTRGMYRNKYNNYTNQVPKTDPNNIDFFAKKYLSQIYKVSPSYKEEQTKKGVELIKFENIPENFSEDLVNVTTSPWFVFRDGRGKISEKTPFNIFKLISYETNHWGGEGNVKYQYGVSQIGNNNEETYDSVGSVPLGKDLKGASVSTNRRIRF